MSDQQSTAAVTTAATDSASSPAAANTATVNGMPNEGEAAAAAATPMHSNSTPTTAAPAPSDASASAASPPPSPASPAPAAAPAAAPVERAVVRLPHRVADYFICVGAVRSDRAAFHFEAEHRADLLRQLRKELSKKRSRGEISAEEESEALREAELASQQHDASQPKLRKPHKAGFVGRVLDRYPRQDWSDAEFPKDIEYFCFPHQHSTTSSFSSASAEGGLELSSSCRAPESHAFALTEADGTRVYGVTFRFWESLNMSEVEEAEKMAFGPYAEEVARMAAEAEMDATLDGKHHHATHKRKASSATFGGPMNGGGVRPALQLYIPKCFVLVSHWPYYSQFERFLSVLHRSLALSGAIGSVSSKIPVERVLMNFIAETPLPPRGKFEVECKSFLNPHAISWPNDCPWSIEAGADGVVPLSGEKKVPFLFSRPPPNKMPLRDFPLCALFRWMSLNHILTLYAAVLTEKRVLFMSDRLFKLTIAAETMSALLCPFYWRHIYIPLLPARMTDFIAAPMPFMMGIHRSYLPDALMLDGVVLVDLDEDTITIQGDDSLASIPALPPNRLASLQRHLKKHITDPTQPLRSGQTIPDSDIEAAFLKFHVRLLENYRDYLEAPSEFVLDKFQKARFVGEHPELTSECESFFNDLMETQMMQCFVDDRYDQSRRGGVRESSSDTNLDILFFDECIDAACGRPTTFLLDSSQAIQTSNRFHAPEPSMEGLPKGASYTYRTLPLPLSENLFGTPRPIEDLAGDSTMVGGLGGGGGGAASSGTSSSNATSFTLGGGSISGRRLDMENLSMRLFTEKRLYSQHFHTLRLRSAKQDAASKDILNYLKSSQAIDEEHLAELERCCSMTVDRDTMETGTSIDAAWNAVRKAVQDEVALQMDSFRTIREDVCVPLYASSSSRAHQLRILFQEATLLDTKVARGKSAVERAKSRSLAAWRKYESCRESLRSATPSTGISTSEVARLVSLQNESEDARLDLDESETAFQTLVREYETRMPQIIAQIRSLNQQRIQHAKEALASWAQSKRTVLVQMLASLDGAITKIEAMDATKDLTTFSEGTVDFWMNGTANTATTANGAGTTTTTTTTNTISPSQTAVNDNTRTVSTTNNSHSDLQESEPSSTIAAASSPDSQTHTVPATESSPSSSDVATGVAAEASTSVPGVSIAPIDTTSVTSPSTATGSPDQPPRKASSSSAASSSSSASSSVTSPAASTPMPQPSPTASSRKLSAPIGTTSPSASSPASTTSTTTSSSSSSPRALSYALNLWGSSGFERAVAQSQQTRRGLKELIVCLNQLLEVSDTKTKKLATLAKSLPETPSAATSALAAAVAAAATPSSSSSTQSSVTLGSGQRAVWDLLRSRAGTLAKGRQEFQNTLGRVVGDLSLVKGELKMSVTRFQAHRLKLEKELATANEELARCAAQKDRTQRALQLLAKQQQATVQNITTNGLILSSTSTLNNLNTSVGSSTSLTQSPSATQLPDGSASPTSPLSSLVPQKQLEALNESMDKVSRDAKEAQHAHTLAMRHAQAVQRKHDICISRLLRLFEKKERHAIAETKKALSALGESIHNHLVAAPRTSDEAILTALRRCPDPTGDLREFAENVTGKKLAELHQQAMEQAAAAAAASPLSIATAAIAGASSSSSGSSPSTLPSSPSFSSTNSAPLASLVSAASPSPLSAGATSPPSPSRISLDWGIHLGPSHYSSAASLLQLHIGFVRSCDHLLIEHALADETEVKAFKRLGFSIKSIGATQSSLGAALASFITLIDRMAEITDDMARAGTQLAQPMSKLKSNLKDRAKTKEKEASEKEKSWKKALEDRDKAVLEEKKAEEAARIAQAKADEAKVAAAQGNNSTAPTGPGGSVSVSSSVSFFSSLMNSARGDLNARAASAQRDLTKARGVTRDKEALLGQATQRRNREMSQLLSEMQNLEVRRWKSQSEILASVLSRHGLHLNKLQTLVHNFSCKVEQISADMDVAHMLSQTQSTIHPPEHVVEDYEKYLRDKAAEEQAKATNNANNSDAAGSMSPRATSSIVPLPQPTSTMEPATRTRSPTVTAPPSFLQHSARGSAASSSPPTTTTNPAPLPSARNPATSTSASSSESVVQEASGAGSAAEAGRGSVLSKSDDASAEPSTSLLADRHSLLSASTPQRAPASSLSHHRDRAESDRTLQVEEQSMSQSIPMTRPRAMSAAGERPSISSPLPVNVAANTTATSVTTAAAAAAVDESDDDVQDENGDWIRNHARKRTEETLDAIAANTPDAATKADEQALHRETEMVAADETASTAEDPTVEVNTASPPSSSSESAGQPSPIPSDSTHPPVTTTDADSAASPDADSQATSINETSTQPEGSASASIATAVDHAEPDAPGTEPSATPQQGSAESDDKSSDSVRESEEQHDQPQSPDHDHPQAESVEVEMEEEVKAICIPTVQVTAAQEVEDKSQTVAAESKSAPESLATDTASPAIVDVEGSMATPQDDPAEQTPAQVEASAPSSSSTSSATLNPPDSDAPATSTEPAPCAPEEQAAASSLPAGANEQAQSPVSEVVPPSPTSPSSETNANLPIDPDGVAVTASTVAASSTDAPDHGAGAIASRDSSDSVSSCSSSAAAAVAPSDASNENETNKDDSSSNIEHQRQPSDVPLHVKSKKKKSLLKKIKKVKK